MVNAWVALSPIGAFLERGGFDECFCKCLFEE